MAPAAEVAAPAAEANTNDLVLEVVVSTEGDKAVFRLPEGSTNEQAADAVVSFCSAHVGGDDLEQCTKALSQVRPGAVSSTSLRSLIRFFCFLHTAA